jgi:hypothetical protein
MSLTGAVNLRKAQKPRLLKLTARDQLAPQMRRVGAEDLVGVGRHYIPRAFHDLGVKLFG